MKYFCTLIIVFCTSLLFGQTKISKENCASRYDSNLHRRIYLYVDLMPEFPGGVDSLKSFIRNNLMWPNTEDDFVGKVYISVIVEADGSLTNKKVFRGIDISVDIEALNVIDKMPKWNAGKCKGKSVPVEYLIPVAFVLY